MGIARRLTRRPRMLATGWIARVRHFLPAPLPAHLDDATVETARRVRPYTMTSPARVVSLIDAVQHVADARLPGAIVECGVWKGGSMMAAALTLQRCGEANRELYLFDTFSGMPAPTSEDVDSAYDGFSLARMWRRRRRDGMNWHGIGAAEVRTAMAATGYPCDRVHLIEGRVEDTVPASAPDRIALLRLDVDWYAPTRHALEHLYPRLVSGGVIVLDDYGHYEGARRAVDEVLEQRGEHLLLHRVDYTGRIGVKTG